MEISLPNPGSYVVAVSGGVDSMSLLHMLNKRYKGKSDRRLIVAHLDHGIRHDSTYDRKLVQETARKLGLTFVYDEAKLGPGASEALAREKRYKFLEKVRTQANAESIVTAHHQDDLLETAIINMMRGSGRKGLTSLSSSKDRVRPLLNYSKADLLSYAKENNLEWREDSTNTDINYLRNYIRANIVTRLDADAKKQLIEIINKLSTINSELDDLISELLEGQSKANEIDRQWFNQLPHNISREVFASWLRKNGIRNFDKKTLERLVVAAKVSPKGRHFPVMNHWTLEIKGKRLALDHIER